MKPFLHSPRSGALHSAATPPFIRAAGAPFIRRVAALFILCAAAPRASAQCAAQGVTLKPGWNAVYVEVSPEADATAVFGPWPVDSVGVYDPASFLATRQFSADGGSDGLVSSPIFMWNREYPEATSVTRVPAGVVCLCFNTNLASGAEGTFSTNLVGVPAAPRTTWHRSEGGEVLNYFGFSVRPGAAVAPGAYLAGFGDLAGGSLLRIGGKRREDPPSRLPVYSNDTVADGEVLLVGATAPSDWSGALHVSPMDGLDFGTNATLRTLSVRNDGGAPRTVSLKLDRAVAELDDRLPFGPSLLVWRDADVARTNAAWNALEGFGAFASKRLAAGETWRLQFGLDRASVPAGLVQGIPFGALLTALDDDGGSQMKATVPLRAETSGADAARTAWPSGLWIADVALDTVDFASAENPAPAGGVLKLRLPLHVDAEGRVRLLQRVVAAGEADAAGNRLLVRDRHRDVRVRGCGGRRHEPPAAPLPPAARRPALGLLHAGAVRRLRRQLQGRGEARGLLREEHHHAVIRLRRRSLALGPAGRRLRRLLVDLRGPSPRRQARRLRPPLPQARLRPFGNRPRITSFNHPTTQP